MQRRTFVLSVGGTALTGGAVLGSGALSQVTADREATVEVAEDESGLIGITLDETSNHVEKTDGVYSITLDGTNANENVSGVNADAETVLGGVVTSILNQSGQEVELTIDVDDDTNNNLIEISGWGQDGDTWVSTNDNITEEGEDIVGEPLTLGDGEGLHDGDFVVTEEVTVDDSVAKITITAETTS